MVQRGIRNIATLAVAVALFSVSLNAQSRETQTRTQLFQQGSEALYGLDFSIAEAKFRELATLEPDNPSNWNYVASAIWLKIMSSQEKLNMESFAGASLGTQSSQDVVTPEIEKELRDVVKTAIAKADAILDKKETRNDVRALYAKGVSKATIAAFEAVAKKRYKAALDNASAAKDLHEKVLKQDPEFTDARLSIGMYKYAMGAIPGPLRLFLCFCLSGDKAGGIADVDAVARGNGLAATDAKMILVVLYNREKQYEKSIETLKELHKRYPRNYLLEMSGAAVQSRMARHKAAVAAYEAVLSKIDTRRDGYERMEAPKVMLLLATANIHGQNLPEARRIWNIVLVDPRSTDTDRGNARLWMGKMYDVEGQRQKALEQYDAILKPELKAAPALKEEAARFRKTAYKF